ncbi:MAG TPA: UDP-N-acetylmuramoyl-L-alanyl-D-glutamate--2,6-diaminopimelate ligase [Polyangiaceae bacterium]|jgi:UDP-N-acetylmuramoyl-L-alanyl-D-glutamate--2,6-diaminopimelate ligase|nr:UDP-N-acetylmuramoyl-L-alanyl-D-glutamate--2,6-diaminopimelate ligase [Polyangiaceae bacterium]
MIPAPPDWSRRLVTVGITGTNGKTSTTRWTAACLARVARPVAQTTTLGSYLDDAPFEAERDFDGFLATMRAGLEGGGRFAAIEVTSEALARGFARAWPCRIGVFTNLTHDHLDAHGSPEHYLASKAQLFVGLPPGGCAVLNGADAASELLAEVIPEGVRVVRYAVESRGEVTGAPELRAASVEVTWEGTRVVLEGRGALAAAPTELRIRAIGDVYAENAMAALAAAMVAGVPAGEAAEALASAPVPPGRFEPVTVGDAGPRVVVDYAHTPDALARTLAIARRLCRGSLVVVFGAGGDRDRDKRAPMGVSASTADRVVLTSDNPRREDPARIAAQIRDGIDSRVAVSVELDRRAAIRSAILDAAEDDVVLVAGKGHETAQTAGGRTLPFDDATESRSALRERSGASSPTSST